MTRSEAARRGNQKPESRDEKKPEKLKSVEPESDENKEIPRMVPVLKKPAPEKPDLPTVEAKRVQFKGFPYAGVAPLKENLQPIGGSYNTSYEALHAHCFFIVFQFFERKA